MKLSADRPVAVLIPCLNEELTIGKVVDDVHRVLPDAAIHVIDNGSTDQTAQIAVEHGAEVLIEPRRGKGIAIRMALRRVDADVYAMIDGDDTYPAEALPALVAPVVAGAVDMAVGSRTMKGSASTFARLNRLGNWVYPSLLRFLIGTRLTDILSGLRVMSREFVRGVPLVGSGFEIEAELTVKAIERGYRLVELPIDLRSRPAGSASKIRIIRDGVRILWTIILLFRDYRPMAFFGAIGTLFVLAGLVPGYVVVSEFLATGLVPRLPSAILAAALELAGMVLFAIGLVLSSLARRFEELETKLEMITGDVGARRSPETGSADVRVADELAARVADPIGAAISPDRDHPDAAPRVDEERVEADRSDNLRRGDLERAKVRIGSVGVPVVEDDLPD
jgi:glycosyltransferase involved in cell wall biosynthesis